MNQYEAIAELADELPELKKELTHLSVLGSAHHTMQVLVSYTSEKIARHDFRQVNKCMRLAEKIYNKGNVILKSAVENTFVYSFSRLQQQCSSTEWRLVKAGMPIMLFTLYIQQIIKSH